MNKYQKILNLLAINNNAQYREDSRCGANYRIEIENDDTIIFYEGDHTKPDSKKVIDWKNGKYTTYENINWNEQSKPVEWQVYREFLILDYQHICDGLSECPTSLELNPYINEQTKEANETAYVLYLHKQPNRPIINGMRRVWINPNKDIEKQVLEAGKNINGYPKYWITDKQVKQNIKEFNASNNFEFKTKFNLYVTDNEGYFNFLAPEEFFKPFNEILKSLGFKYKWEEIKGGDEIFKFDDQKNSVYHMVRVLSNWNSRGALNDKQIEFFKKLPPIAKEYPYLTTPSEEIIDKINKKAEEESAELTCEITDKKLLSLLSEYTLSPAHRYTKFCVFFTNKIPYIWGSYEEYNKKTKKWEKWTGENNITPITSENVSFFHIPIIAQIVALSNFPYAEKFIKLLLNHFRNEYDKGEDTTGGVIPFMESMLSDKTSYTAYFKINLPKFKNKVFYINRMPCAVFETFLSSEEARNLESLSEDQVDKNKITYLTTLNFKKELKKE